MAEVIGLKFFGGDYPWHADAFRLKKDASEQQINNCKLQIIALTLILLETSIYSHNNKKNFISLVEQAARGK